MSNMATKTSNIPMVAVITRTKNRTFMLERAIKCVEAQTYDNYVHVIFNDGGDKGAVEALVKKYGNNRRIVIHNQESVGITKALNKAIKAVDSKYVTILDDDDTWPIERLEKTIPFLEETGEKSVVVKMDIVEEEIRGDKVRTISQRLHPESGDGEINLFKQCQKNYISNGSVTYARDVYYELGGYDESLPVGEDWDFGIRLLLKYDVAFLRTENSLHFYHQRPHQDGDSGNSVHAGVGQQEKTINIIRNRYLRRDLNAGKFGVGYIMNKLEFDEIKTVRLEGHINHCTKQIIDHVDKTPDRAFGLSITGRAVRKMKRFKRG